MASKTTPEDWKAIHTLAEACGVTSSTAQHWWIDGQVKYVAKPDMGYYEFQLQNEAGTVFAKKHCNGQVMTPGSVVYGKVIIPTTSTWAGIQQAQTKIETPNLTKGFKLDTWSTDEGKPLPCKHCGSVKHLSKMCGKNFNPYPKKNFNSYPLCASCGMEAHPGQECPMLLHCICEHGPETDGPEISCYVHGACEKCTEPAGGPFSVVHYAEHAAKDCPHHCYAHGKSKPCLDCWAVPGKCVHGNTHSACTECYMKNLCHGKDKAKCSCSPSPNLTADAIKKMAVIKWPKMHTMQAEKMDVAGYEPKTAHPGWTHIGYSQYSSGGIVPEPSDNPVGNTYPDGFVKMALGMDVPVAKMVITLANEPAWVCECTHPDCTTTGAYGEKIHEQRDFPHGSKGKQAAGEMRLHHIKVTGHTQAAVFERVKVHTPKPFVLTKEQENFLQQLWTKPFVLTKEQENFLQQLWSSEFGGVTQKFIVGDGQLCQHHEVPGKCEECAKAAYLAHKKSYVCPHGHHIHYCSLCDEEKAKSKEDLLAYKKKHEEEKKAKYAETLAKLKKITAPVNVPTSDPVGMCTHGYQHWTCTHCKEESALAFAKFNELGKMLGMTPTAAEKAAKTKTLGQHQCCVHCSQVTHYAHTNGCPSQTSGGHTCTLDDHGPDSACEACNGVAEMKKPPKLVDPFANLEKAIGTCEGELCLKCKGEGCMSCDGSGVV